MSWRSLLVALIIGAAVYALAGFVLAPVVVKKGLTTALARHTEADVALGRVTVNPISLTVTVDDLAVRRPDGEADVRVARLSWRHPLTYLFTPGWSVAELTLESPRLAMRATPDWQAGVVAALSPDSVVAIGRLTVKDGELLVTDEGEPRFNVSAVKLDIRNLGTAADGPGGFTLTGLTDRGGRLSAEGSLTLSPMTLDARVDLAGVDIGGLAVGGTSAATTADGLVLASSVLSGKVSVQLGDRRTDIVGDLSLEHVSLVDAGTGTAVFSAEHVSGAAVTVRPTPLAVSAKSLRVSGTQLHIARGTDGRVTGTGWLSRVLRGPESVFPTTERIEWVDGRITLADFAVSPSVRLAAKNVHGTVATVRSGTTVSVTLEGQLPGTGSSRLNASWPTAGPARSGAWLLTVSELDAQHLSPYLETVAGRPIAAGGLDMVIRGAVNDGVVDMTNKIRVAGLRLGEQQSPPASGEWPLDLVVALLEDTDGNVRIDIPLPAAETGQAGPPLAAFRSGLGTVVSALANRPFDVLAELADTAGTDLSQVTFAAGSAAPGEEASHMLAGLASALAQRPGLGVEIVGRYDPLADRAALARDQINLHIALATSAGPPGNAATSSLNLDDARVISVLEEFAAERLNPPALAAIRARFGESGPARSEAIYEALVANEPVSGLALKSLARFRAQSVVGELTAAQVASERIRVGGAVATSEAENGAIHLPIDLWY